MRNSGYNRAIERQEAARTCANLQVRHGLFLTDTQTYSQSSDGASKHADVDIPLRVVHQCAYTVSNMNYLCILH